MSQHVDQRMRTWIGRTLIDGAGQRIGRVEDIYTDDVGGQPAWIAVATGRFGLHIIFLPFAGATPAGGDEVRVHFSRNLIKEAPMAGKGGRLTQEEVVRLYDHYGFDLEAEEVRERAMQGRPGRPDGSDEPAPTDEPAAAAEPAAAIPCLAAHARTESAPPEKPAVHARKPTMRPTSSRFGSIEPTTVAEEPPARPDSPDSPLFWNHDDRIDSIRPPREPARPGSR